MNKPALIFGLLIGVAVGYISPTWASRNDAGTYSLPSGNPVVTNTKITSTWGNTTMGDVRTEITNSLDRNGRGAMLAPLKVPAGTAAEPSLTCSTDIDTGIYFPAANQISLQCNGAAVQAWTTAGTAVTGTLTVTGSVTVSNGVIATRSSGGSGGNFTGGTGGGTGGVFTGGPGDNGVGISGTGSGVGWGASLTGGGSTDGGVGGIGAVIRGGIGGDGLTSEASYAGAGNGRGIYAAGKGTGMGVEAVGGVTAVGGKFSNGTAASASARTNAIVLANGDLDMSGVTNPDSTVALSNRLTPLAIPKAFGILNIASATPTVASGMNIATVTCAANDITITLAQALSGFDATHLGTCIANVRYGADGYTDCVQTAAGVFVVHHFDTAGQKNLCAVGSALQFIVFGAQ